MNSTQNLKELTIGNATYQTTLTKKFEQRKKYVQPDTKKILCVIPGIVQRVYVQKGSRIARNQAVVVLEAMKMQNDILSPTEGTIREIYVRAGQMVVKGQVLAEFE